MNILFIAKITIWLIIYSIIGWMYETLICSVSAKKFINRGFLNGPYCPIYGFGALFDIFILGRINNVFLLFILGVIITCSLEYLTSYLMEKLFHARWWDYSERKFNINGRVCLLGAVVFGLFSVILIKLIHPAIKYCTDLLPNTAIYTIAIIFSVGFITDIIITVSGFSDFNKKIIALSELFEEKKSDISNKLRNAPAHTIFKTIYENSSHKFNMQQRRMIKAFPKFRSTTNNKLLSEIKNIIRKRK